MLKFGIRKRQLIGAKQTVASMRHNTHMRSRSLFSTISICNLKIERFSISHFAILKLGIPLESFIWIPNQTFRLSSICSITICDSESLDAQDCDELTTNLEIRLRHRWHLKIIKRELFQDSLGFQIFKFRIRVWPDPGWAKSKFSLFKKSFESLNCGGA